jgi:uncharacterized damage-inducible protein DinB
MEKSFMKNADVWKRAIHRALFGVALAAMILPSTPAASNLSDADRQEGLAQLERTRKEVVDATKGLSEAQWKFKPAPDRWSVAEVLEHIALSEEFLFENTSQKVMQAPSGEADRDVKAGDTAVLAVIPDRSQKAQAPEPLHPTGRWTPKEALDEFSQRRARTVEFLKSTPDLRDHVVDSPIGQPLDAYQWILFISAHSERHTKQMLEVKADANFPKK